MLSICFLAYHKTIHFHMILTFDQNITETFSQTLLQCSNVFVLAGIITSMAFDHRPRDPKLLPDYCPSHRHDQSLKLIHQMVLKLSREQKWDGRTDGRTTENIMPPAPTFGGRRHEKKR